MNISSSWQKDALMTNGWRSKIQITNLLVYGAQRKMTTAACSFCKADISVDHMGFGSLKQHANGSKHKQLAGVSNI